MSLRSRIRLIFNARAAHLLDEVEEPPEMLDYAYAQQLELLAALKRGPIEVATSKHQLAQEMADIEVRREEAEDVFFGQAVMLWARWALVAAGGILILWARADVVELSARIAVVVVLMAVNFYLDGRFLMEKPANRYLIALASLLGMGVVTLLVLGTDRAGYANPLFVLYYPVVFAFALVFPPGVSLGFTAAAAFAYALAVVLGGLGFAADLQHDKVMLARLVTLTATGCLGTYYWRLQRRRRQAAGGWTRSAAEA